MPSDDSIQTKYKWEVGSMVVLCVAVSVKGTGLGAPDEVSVTDEDVVKMTKIAIEGLNKLKKEGEADLELIEVLSATKQVVAGIKADVMAKVRDGSQIRKCEFSVVDGVSGPVILKAECEGLDRKISN
ncbi:hypothetical protein RUM44_011997 [Polyplax serrata]|uniref:Cystatin domain-containing protein n=1 Tax=Polyplax serrata TaxID=468196 RepID=A0ABR1BDW7_POLSC